MAEKKLIHDLEDFKNYWNKLTAIKYFKLEEMEIIQKDTRAAILGVLRFGRRESSGYLRYVLNADEIYEEIKNRFKRKDSKSTVYFHLKNLVEYGFVDIVGIKDTNSGRGRKYTAYYGRTAKMFLIQYDNNIRNPNLAILQTESLKKFLVELNPETSLGKITEILNIITFESKNQDDFINWQKQHEGLLDKHGLSLFETYELLEKLYIVHHRLFEAVGSLKQLLHYE